MTLFWLMVDDLILFTRGIEEPGQLGREAVDSSIVAIHAPGGCPFLSFVSQQYLLFLVSHMLHVKLFQTI